MSPRNKHGPNIDHRKPPPPGGFSIPGGHHPPSAFRSLLGGKVSSKIERNMAKKGWNMGPLSRSRNDGNATFHLVQGTRSGNLTGTRSPRFSNWIHFPKFEALSSHLELYPERAAVFLTRLANDDKERDAGIRGQTQCLARDWYLICTVLLIFVPQSSCSFCFQILVQIHYKYIEFQAQLLDHFIAK